MVTHSEGTFQTINIETERAQLLSAFDYSMIFDPQLNLGFRLTVIEIPLENNTFSTAF